MLHYVKNGARELSDKAVYRLTELEKSLGIEPPKPIVQDTSDRLKEDVTPYRITSPTPKNSIAKLREQVQNIQAQINAMTAALDEIESEAGASKKAQTINQLRAALDTLGPEHIAEVKEMARKIRENKT